MTEEMTGRGERGFSPETYKHIESIMGAYNSTLWADSNYAEVNRLTPSARTEYDIHSEQLTSLQDLLEGYVEHPSSFQIRLQRIDEDDRFINVRLKSNEDGDIPEGEENAQPQLNFHLQFVPQTNESLEDAIHAEGLQIEDPQAAMQAVRRATVDSRLTINTVGVYRDSTTGNVRIKHQAGIQLSLRDGKIDVAGIKYVGTRPHAAEVRAPEGLKTEQVLGLHQVVHTLARKPRYK
jgi:hypothetical protein